MSNVKTTSDTKESLISVVSGLGEGQLIYQWEYEMMQVLEIGSKEEIINVIKCASAIKRVDRDDLLGSSFDDLASWSLLEDGLFLVNENLLICLAEEDAKLIA